MRDRAPGECRRRNQNGRQEGDRDRRHFFAYCYITRPEPDDVPRDEGLVSVAAAWTT